MSYEPLLYEPLIVFPVTTGLDCLLNAFAYGSDIRERAKDIFGSKIASFFKHFRFIGKIGYGRIIIFTFCTFGLYFVYVKPPLYPSWWRRLLWKSRPKGRKPSLRHLTSWNTRPQPLYPSWWRRLLWKSRPKGRKPSLRHLTSWNTRPQGIPNLGNTCYMNSILQVFCWTPGLGQQLQSQLRSMVQKEEATKETPGNIFTKLLKLLPFYGDKDPEKSITEALFDLVYEVHEGRDERDNIVSRKLPEAILHCARKVNHQFDGHQQQDSFEMFNTIVSAIEDEMLSLHPLKQTGDQSGDYEQIMNTCPVSHLFGGEFITVYCYDSCEHIDVVRQRFTSICVPVIADKMVSTEENEEGKRRYVNQDNEKSVFEDTPLAKPSDNEDNTIKDVLNEHQAKHLNQENLHNSDCKRLENLEENKVPNLTNDVECIKCETFEKATNNTFNEMNSPSDVGNTEYFDSLENENALNVSKIESENDESLKLTKELKPFDWKNEGPKTNRETKNVFENDPLKLDSEQEMEVPGCHLSVDLSLSKQKGCQREHENMTVFKNSFTETCTSVDMSINKSNKEGQIKNNLTNINNTQMIRPEIANLQRPSFNSKDESEIPTQQYLEADFKKEECVEEFVNVFPSNNGLGDEDNKSLTIVQQKSVLHSLSFPSEGNISSSDSNLMQGTDGNGQSGSNSLPDNFILKTSEDEVDNKQETADVGPQNILDPNAGTRTKPLEQLHINELVSSHNGNLQTNILGDDSNDAQDKILGPSIFDVQQSMPSELDNSYQSAPSDPSNLRNIYPDSGDPTNNDHSETLPRNLNVGRSEQRNDTEHQFTGMSINHSERDMSLSITSESKTTPSEETKCDSELDDCSETVSITDQNSISSFKTKELVIDSDYAMLPTEQSLKIPEPDVSTNTPRHENNDGSFSNSNSSDTAQETMIQTTVSSKINERRKAFKTLKETENLKTSLEVGLVEQVKIEDFSEELLGCIKCTEEGHSVGKGFVHKRLMVLQPPAVLVLQINRFRQTMHGTLEKIQGEVSFPKILDLSPYCSEAVKLYKENGDKVIYNLYGVVAHNGTIEQGHYYSYVKTNKSRSSKLHYYQFLAPKTEPENMSDIITKFLMEETADPETARGDKPKEQDKWFYITDSFVSETTEDRVLHEANACILMYERIK